MDEWFLQKIASSEVVGPEPLAKFRNLAAEAKISPMDRLSNDGRKTWRRAPMVPELQMDWLIEMEDNSLYGPTSVGTLQEFLAIGEINENVTIINTLEGRQSRLKDLPFFQASPHRIRGQQDLATGTSEEGTELTPGLKQRNAWLERQVMDLQREITRWQERSQSLRQQFIEATGQEPK